MPETPVLVDDVEAAPLSFLAELLGDLTPKQKVYLAALPEHNWAPWTTCKALGFSTHTLHQWLQQPHFIEARNKLTQTYLESIGATYERTLLEIARVAYSDPRKLYHPKTGELLPMQDVDADAAAAIQSIEVETYRTGTGEDAEERETKRTRMHDKIGALRNLLQAHGKLIERHEHTGKDGSPLVAGVMVVPGVMAEAAWSVAAQQQQPALAESERKASESVRPA